MEADGAQPFSKPVDRKVFANYYSVVSHPMDFGTILLNCSKEKYRRVGMLAADVHLTLNVRFIACTPAGTHQRCKHTIHVH